MKNYILKIKNRKIIIKNISNIQFKLTILDVYGKLVKEEILSPNKKFKTPILREGTYHLFVNNEFKERVIVSMGCGGILDLLDILTSWQ